MTTITAATVYHARERGTRFFEWDAEGRTFDEFDKVAIFDVATKNETEDVLNQLFDHTQNDQSQAFPRWPEDDDEVGDTPSRAFLTLQSADVRLRTAYEFESRSTSVGDMILLVDAEANYSFWMVASIGFLSLKMEFNTETGKVEFTRAIGTGDALRSPKETK
tara:strand:- start:81 stop:569 length:489 start_codon:yes stop_codon:yes gene_type:complete